MNEVDEMAVPVVIEKDVPLPAPKGRQNGASKYPFEQMSVGDSFAYPASEKTVVSAARQWAKKKGGTHKFKVLSTTPAPVMGVDQPASCRCWRVA